jgi:phage baseplate assembly protein W
MSDPLGTDISATTGLAPSFELVTGQRLLGEALHRRLTTQRGTLFYAPNYGTDVREALLARLDETRLAVWRSRIEAECRKDARVMNARATLAFDLGAERRLTIAIEVETAEGPFRLAVAVSAVSVELLREG